MSILVLGGAGYIGSHAVYQLINQQNDVVVVDNLQTGHREAIHPEATFYKGDIRNIVFLRYVFKKESIDAVIHFAANSLVGESMKKPLAYFDNNVYGTQVILQAMTEFNVKHIVFSSTAAVYGNPAQVPIAETSDPNPTNTYGETKYIVEKMMYWMNQAHDIKYVSLRYFNVAGALHSGEIGEDHRPETHLIPIILQTALGQHDHITIFGEDYDTPDGSPIRDYIHVDDLIQAHLQALDYLQHGGASDVFNLGSSEGFSVKEMIKSARKVTGAPILVESGPRRDGDPSVLIASSDKAQKVLGWHPSRISIETIIKDAWNWHRTHPDGYGRE
ncbi:UDP-glucose 4-epimerase GalE [Lentibacillus sp. CBA3610]|uniref:UDP-glucose 4-epimerase GalE n=1 Tax=Lentibacillus sp. CBA3610 TaxID=2518176 RepID=UPI0015958C10|nr:UDP-glucose 4-epimerase GalE [Lentibacillus sp. CBA3610]QKY70359.1 UDP-glucose 4-epimerase GalE [Lentibacillus sp. CBA3610]